MSDSKFIEMPHGCKPSKVLSRDANRPVLAHGYIETDARELKEESDRKPPRLIVCDSYKLARIPLAGDVDAGFVPPEALKAAEKPKATFAANGTVIVAGKDGSKSEWPRPEVGTPINADQLIPDFGPEPQRIGLNAKFLYELAQAMGSENVELTFMQNPETERINPLKPMGVRPIGLSGADGLLMPVRLNA